MDFHDGPSNTILLTEIADSDIGWLEPKDLVLDQMSLTINDKSRPSISCSRRRGPYIVFADFIHAYSVSSSLSPDTLRALVTIDGGEEVAMANDYGLGLVSLTNGPVTDEALDRFAHWDEVHDLWLTRTKVSDSGLKCLRSADLHGKLNLLGTSIGDEGLKHLTGRTYFYKLNLSGTRITDLGLAHLAGLTEMHYLDLSHTPITDGGLKYLHGLNLSGLDLTDTNVTDKGIAEFQRIMTRCVIDH